MGTVQKRVRNFFILQAIVLVYLAMGSMIRYGHTYRPIPPLRHYTFLAAYLAASVVFAIAWWSTRKPSPYRNPWAFAAGLVSLAGGAYYLVGLHSVTPGILSLAVGAGSLALFGRGESAPKAETQSKPIATSASAPPPRLAPAAPVKPVPVKRAPVAGDRTSSWTYPAFVAISTVAEFAAIAFWSRWAYTHHLPRNAQLPWYFLFTVAVLLSTLLHECGHALIAWGYDMKLLSFNAGPLRFRKSEGKWSFKFNPAGFFELGGSVSVAPTHPEQPRFHDLWMIAAGPLANIYCGGILLWAVLHLNWPLYSLTWSIVAYTASFCFIAAIGNLLPFMTREGGYSDGARILQILTKSPLDEYHRALASLQSTLVTDRRPRDLDVAAMQRAAALFPAELRGLHLQLCSHDCHRDAGRIPEARAALAAAETIYDGNTINLPAPLHTSFIFGHAFFNRDAAAARLWWDRMEAKQPKKLNADYWLARAALLWIEGGGGEGNLSEAVEALEKADAEAQKLPECGAYDADRDRCALLRQEFENGALQAVPHPSQSHRDGWDVQPTPALKTSTEIFAPRTTSKPSLEHPASTLAPGLPNLTSPVQKAESSSEPPLPVPDRLRQSREPIPSPTTQLESAAVLAQARLEQLLGTSAHPQSRKKNRHVSGQTNPPRDEEGKIEAEEAVGYFDSVSVLSPQTTPTLP